MTKLYNTGISLSIAHKIFNPTPEEIEWAIDKLIPVLYHFVILLSDDKLNNYMQTVATSGGLETEIEYLVEIRFEYGEKIGESFKQLQYTTSNTDELKKMFRMYALDIIPNLASWKDVTEKIKNLPDLETQRRNANG